MVGDPFDPATPPLLTETAGREFFPAAFRRSDTPGMQRQSAMPVPKRRPDPGPPDDARAQVHYLAALARHRASPTVTIPLSELAALRARRPDEEWFNRAVKKRVARQLNAAPIPEARLQREAINAARSEAAELHRMRSTPLMLDLLEKSPALRERLGVNTRDVPGLLMRRWFGGWYQSHSPLTVSSGGGSYGWRGHVELPLETKALLASEFQEDLWARWFRIPPPGSAMSGDVDEEAQLVLRGLLVRSYRMEYAGGRGRARMLKNQPLKVWTLPPRNVLPYLAGAALHQAKRATRSKSVKVPYEPGSWTEVFGPTQAAPAEPAEGNSPWTEAFDPVVRPPAKKARPRSDDWLCDESLDKPQPVKVLRSSSKA